MYSWKKYAFVVVLSLMFVAGFTVMAKPAKAASLECSSLGHKIVCQLSGASQVNYNDWGFSGFSPYYTTVGTNGIEFSNPGCGFFTVNVTWNGGFYYEHSSDWVGYAWFC